MTEKPLTVEQYGAALVDVVHERSRQDKKWGESNHDMGIWLAILEEEIGEFSRHYLELKFSPDSSSLRLMRKQAVQVAAVAVAIVECIDRGEWND